MSSNYSKYLQEIKENCAPLRNVYHSHKKSLPQLIESITHRIPLIEKVSIHKICSQQEQKIYQNIHKLKRYNLLLEIGRVNPQLHHELRAIKSDQLPLKLVEYQKIKQLNLEINTEGCSQDSYDNDCCAPCDIMHSGGKFLRLPCIKNMMDEYENSQSEQGDSYLNKYLDLN